jgi:hypothetical protein
MKHLSTSYYVSSKYGSDENDGCSEKSPFQSLGKINELHLKPGDKVLLERNSVFENQYLCIRDEGEENQRIEIGAYGEGNPPVIHANGSGIWYQDYGVDLDAPTHVRAGYVSSAVLLYDVAYIDVQDLEITNSGGGVIGETYSAAHKMNRTGVAVVAKNRGTRRSITLRNLCIHHVEGNVYDKHMNNGGIYVTALKPDWEEKTKTARYADFLLENCFVYKVSRWGIAIGYTYLHEKFQDAILEKETFLHYGHETIVVRNNYVKAAGGDGITVMYALEPLVEHNVADSVASEMNDRVYKEPKNRQGKVAAAIWPWKCKDALFRFNEAVDTRLNQDGMAYDADSGDGTVYEYNYSRLNEGGCVMFCMEQAVHSSFCHNVSYDDLGGTISPAKNPDAYLAHNSFHVREGVPFVRKNMDGGRYQMEDNEIIKIN